VKRREFITLLGGAAAAWPLAARAQQGERIRSIGVLMGFARSDPQWNAHVAALRAALHELGWTDGRNVRIETRWTDADPNPSTAAAELVALSPDVIFACPHTPVASLHQQTRTIPIVAAMSGDPVSAGFVQSYARPGGNVTVFLIFETTINTKYPQLLKNIAPHVTRAAVVHAENTAWRYDFAAIRSAAQSFNLEPVEILVRDAADIERQIDEFSPAPNGGLILPPARRAKTQPANRTCCTRQV
jgi:putative tryptophan/tyrosine transport system substrate-binding protein